jgi:hypothetical protein
MDWRSPARVVLAIVTGMIHIPAAGGVPEIFPSFAIESHAGAPLSEKVSGSFAVERKLFFAFRGNPTAQFFFKVSLKTGGFTSTRIVRSNSAPSPPPGTGEPLALALFALRPTTVIPFPETGVPEMTPEDVFRLMPVGNEPRETEKDDGATIVEVKVVVIT